MTRTLNLALVLTAALLVGAAAAVTQQRYVLADGSLFRIDGTSTLGRYSCIAGRIAGAGTVPEAGPASAEVTVGVASFDCGVSRMNRDFRNALRAEEHPAIRFTLVDARTSGTEARPGAWVPVQVRGRLSLAGEERNVDIRAEGRRAGAGRVRIRGEHAMRMSDFGIDPPSGMMGAVRARDAITVRFELSAVVAD